MLVRVEICFQLRTRNSDFQGTGSCADVGMRRRGSTCLACTRVWPIEGDKSRRLRMSSWVIKQRQEH